MTPPDPRPATPPPPLAPSDLALPSRWPSGPPVRVAGRVRRISATEVRLSDAFATLAVTLAEATPLDDGDLIVAAGVLEGGRLTAARVEERTRPRRAPVVRDTLPEDEAPASETERLGARREGEGGPAYAVGQGLAARSAGLRAIRRFFEARGFVEVETPAVVPSPGLDLHLDAFEARGVSGLAFPGGVGFLITSPEYQMKRLLVGGVPRCYQLTRCFRRGEVGRRHNPEFSMLEWYRAFASVEHLLDDTEALVRAVALELTGGAELRVDGHVVDLRPPFERLPVLEAFHRHAGVSPERALALASEDEEQFFRLLVDRIEPALARAPVPVFLVDYPTPFASLARRKPDDPRVAERFELYVAGVELCNGFGELTCPVEQRERLERDRDERRRRGLAAYPVDERFLAALEEGMPPSAGNALGVERLLSVCLGTSRIQGVLSFPVDWL